MDEPTRGYRYSSARRGRRGPSLAVFAAAAIVVLLVALVVLHRSPEPEFSAVVPTPTPPPPPTTAPTVTATVTATPTPAVELSSDWVEVSTSQETPTPWPTIPAPERRQPTPTPRASECVEYRWSTMQAFIPSAQVLTEIRITNGCNRDLAPTELLFEISGWRQGGLIQSVRAMPFERIRKRHSGLINVGLPGSLDWYDQITVEIVD